MFNNEDTDFIGRRAFYVLAHADDFVKNFSYLKC